LAGPVRSSTAQQDGPVGRLFRFHVTRTVPGTPPLSEFRVSVAAVGADPFPKKATSICVSVKLPTGMKGIAWVPPPVPKTAHPPVVEYEFPAPKSLKMILARAFP
jgi:hypothetical protein